MHRMRAFRWVIVSITILVVLKAAPAAATDFTILEVGTLGGPYHEARAINKLGQVVGRSYTASGVEHAFLWQNGTITDLGTLGGSYSHATGINDAGQVVGFSMTPGDPFRHAFLWQNGTMIDLGTLGDSLIDTRATGINNVGQVVGHAGSVIVGGPQRAFLWQNGTMTDLGTLGGTSSGALAINDFGQVVGASNTAGDTGGHAFLWQDGTMTDLGTLGGDHSEALDINNLGQVVGVSTTADGSHHAFLWQNGTMINLGVAGTISRAWGINDAGQVVGGICQVIFDEFGFEVGAVCRAFLWTSSEGMLALDSLIPPDSGWEQLGALDINEAGEIVGSGLFRGESRAFMLTNRLLASVSFDPTTVHGGTASTGTVRLNTAAGGFTVTLASGNPAVATVPASVTVPAGVTHASFAVPTSLVTASTPVTISASLDGVTRSAVLTVNPAQVDAEAPDTGIVSAVDAAGAPVVAGGATLERSITVSFTGTDNVAVSSFACRIDAGAFAPCSSPATYSALTVGEHRFEVRAADAAGNQDLSPAALAWTVDTPPDTTITSALDNRGHVIVSGSSSRSQSITFTFAGSDNNGVTGFECSVNAAAFAACSSPKTLRGLSPGSHSFRVRAVDSRGFRDASPAVFNWSRR